MPTRLLHVACVTVSLSLPAAADPITGMYLSDSRRQLLVADVVSGQVEPVGLTPVRFPDIAFSPDGRLYGITFTDLYRIDPANGASTLIGTFGSGGGSTYEINALTFSVGGLLYAAGKDILITINPETGHGTEVGHLSGYHSAGDLAFDPSGRLLLTTDSGQLVEVRTDGSGATPIGSLPYKDIFALDTGSDGALYGVRATNDVVLIDPASGAGSIVATLHAGFPLGRTWGGSFQLQLPESSTLLLCALGALLTARTRRAARR